MAGPKLKIAGGQPTRKLRYSVGVGLPSGGGLALVLTYVIGRIDPAMPPEVLAVASTLLASALTGGAMALVAWLTRPALADRPVVDEATVPRPVEPLPPSPE